MEKTRVEAVENSVQPAAVMRHLTEPLGLTDLAMNYYELEPGDSFAFAYHNHEVQEEVFYVIDGTVTFETEDGPVTVEAGEVVRFDRGSSSAAGTAARSGSSPSRSAPLSTTASR